MVRIRRRSHGTPLDWANAGSRATWPGSKMVIHKHMADSSKHKKRKLTDIKMFTMHRIMNRKFHFMCADELTDAFENTTRYAAGSYTGGKVPYHFFIDAEGGCYQLLPLAVIGPGAYGINKQSVHIAVSGDFRAHSPTMDQIWTTVCLCEKMQLALGPKEIRGHTEFGVQSLRNKKCPGELFPLDKIRDEVHARLSYARVQHGRGLAY